MYLKSWHSIYTMVVEYQCAVCNFRSDHVGKYNRHLESKKHLHNVSMAGKPSYTYHCQACCYGTDCSNGWAMHCRSKKHIARAAPSVHACECGRYFHSARARTFHKKNCDWVPAPPTVEEPMPETPPTTLPPSSSTTDPNVLKIMEQMVEQNQQMANHMAQQNEIITNQNEIISKMAENGTGNVTNNNNNTQNNTTNNRQNIQFNFHNYLEENCSDAINLNDFVANIEITENDLIDLLKLDNPRAIGTIITRELKKYKPEERPLHCTDVKRKHVFEKCVGGGWEEHEAEWRTTDVLSELFRDAAEVQAKKICKLYRELPRERLRTNEGQDIVDMACKIHPEKYSTKTKQYAGAYNEILSAVKVSGKQPLDV